MMEYKGTGEKIPKKERKLETEIRKASISRFLSEWLSTPFEERANYDHILDLHFSGKNTKVMRKIESESASLVEVSVFYVDDVIQQIHAVFDSEGAGHCIDVYLQNKALQDYLDKFPIQE